MLLSYNKYLGAIVWGPRKVLKLFLREYVG